MVDKILKSKKILFFVIFQECVKKSHNQFSTSITTFRHFTNIRIKK
jgi:hypothetical protein